MIAQTSYFVQSAKIDLRRYPATRDGYERLCELAGADGVVVLHGGVRGWAETLGCAAGYPKMLFRLLEQYGYVAGVDYYPGEGGQVVEVQLARPDDQSLIGSAPPPGPAPAAEAHQDAAADPPVRSVIESPHTPLYGTHESLQQQQHARMRENTKPDTALTQLLRAEFPRADVALLAAWEANPQVNDCKAAHDALLGFPTATCADWQADLAAAEDRPSVAWPVGLVLACWAQGERVAPRRAPPAAIPAAPAAPRQRGREPRAVEARAPEALSDREIREDTDLHPEDRAAFLAAYEAAPDDAARAEVLCDFRRCWAAWFEEQLAQEREVGAVEVPSAAQVGQIAPLWQAAMGTVQLRVSRQEYDAWLRSARLLALDASLATVAVSSPVHKEGFEHRYLDLVRRALGDVVGFPVQVRVVVGGGP